MSDHTFCRLIERLSIAEHHVKRSEFSVCSGTPGPRCQHFVEGPGGFAAYVTACCRWHARALAYDIYATAKRSGATAPQGVL